MLLVFGLFSTRPCAHNCVGCEMGWTRGVRGYANNARESEESEPADSSHVRPSPGTIATTSDAKFDSCSLAMGASNDTTRSRETLSYAMEKSRDQDLIYFFRGVSGNYKTLREVTKFFKENYDTVRHFPTLCLVHQRFTSTRIYSCIRGSRETSR
jgi:hypothetical protein